MFLLSVLGLLIFLLFPPLIIPYLLIVLIVGIPASMAKSVTKDISKAVSISRTKKSEEREQQGPPKESKFGEKLKKFYEDNNLGED